jgi:hypothetical protein
VEQPERNGRRPARAAGQSARRLPRQPGRRRMQGALPRARQPLRDQRLPGADSVVRLDRRLDLGNQRLRGAGGLDGRRGRGGELRPREPSAAGDPRRRTQLPRHLERPGFAPDLDPRDERDHPARRLPAAGVRPDHGAAAGGHRRGRRALAPGLRGGLHPRRPLRPGRRLHHRRRGGLPERRGGSAASPRLSASVPRACSRPRS